MTVPSRRAVQRAEDVEQRALARAARADDRERLARRAARATRRAARRAARRAWGSACAGPRRAAPSVAARAERRVRRRWLVTSVMPPLRFADEGRRGRRRASCAAMWSSVKPSRTASRPARPSSARRRGSRSSSASASASAGRSPGGTEDAAAGQLDQFGERAVRRLHHRHAARQRFQHVNPLGFGVDARHAEDVDRVEQLELRPPIQLADVRRRRLRRRRASRRRTIADPPAPRYPPAQQPRVGHAGHLPQQHHRVDELAEPFLRADARDVADGRRRDRSRAPGAIVVRRRTRAGTPGCTTSMRARSIVEVPRHLVGVVRAGRDEARSTSRDALRG